MIDIENSIGFLLAKAYQRGAAIFKEEFKGYELTRQQFGVLAFLWQEDGLSQAELATRSQIDRTTIGGLLDRMEKDGLIRRQPHPDDRRAYRVVLTKRGKELEGELDPIARQALSRLVAPLTPDEVDTLRAILVKLRH